MIRGMHAMFYSSQASELRAFLRDKLSLPATDEVREVVLWVPLF